MPVNTFYPSKLFCAAERAPRHSLRYVFASAETYLHGKKSHGGIATSGLEV
jgi:hypothetical protein